MPFACICFQLITICGSLAYQVEVCADVDATKADSDKKSYRLIRLPNGLRALLVHDPPVAAAARCIINLSVFVCLSLGLRSIVRRFQQVYDLPY